MALPTKREKFFLFNSLVCLAQGIEGEYTTIDLRNESCVCGKIDQVDGFMNVYMSDAVFTDARGSEFAFDSFFVHARNIRYVHIPDKMSIVPTIEKQLKLVGGRPRIPRSTFGNSRKGSRLMKRQQETLQMIREMKSSNSRDTDNQK